VETCSEIQLLPKVIFTELNPYLFKIQYNITVPSTTRSLIYDVRFGRQKNSVMVAAGPATKNNCADEGQQQLYQKPKPKNHIIPNLHAIGQG
jgi:hypothetical protein